MSADIAPKGAVFLNYATQDAAEARGICGPRECCEVLSKLLRVPSGLSVPMLKVDPTWDNMREDAAVKALLDDPKNSGLL